MALGTIAGGLQSKNNGIGYDPTRKKVVAGPLGGLGTPRTSMAGGVMDTLNARLTNQASGAVNAALAPKQPAPFNYNADADPVYQAAIRRAQANAATASGNAQAEMNRRGILNSTITGDRIAQIQQSEMGRVSDTILPQLEAQAYGRYRDDINQQNIENQFGLQKGQMLGFYQDDEMKELSKQVLQAKKEHANAKTPEERIAAKQKADNARAILEQLGVDTSSIGSGVTLDQATANQGRVGVQTQSAREFDQTMNYNKDRDKREDFVVDRDFNYGKERDKRSDFVTDRSYNYQVGRDRVGDAQWKQEFDNRVKQQGIDNALQWAANSRANAGLALDREKFNYSKEMDKKQGSSSGGLSSTGFNQLMDIWKATGKAPKGLEGFGVQAGSAFGEEKAESAAKMVDESKGMVDAIRSGQLSPAQASMQIDDDVKLGFYTREEGEFLKSQLGKIAPSQPTPAVTPDVQEAIDSLPSDKEIERIWQVEGKPKNIGKIDFADWYRSPQGRLAGVDFKTWKSLYGPQLKAKN